MTATHAVNRSSNLPCSVAAACRKTLGHAAWQKCTVGGLFLLNYRFRDAPSQRRRIARRLQPRLVRALVSRARVRDLDSLRDPLRRPNAPWDAGTLQFRVGLIGTRFLFAPRLTWQAHP